MAGREIPEWTDTGLSGRLVEKPIGEMLRESRSLLNSGGAVFSGGLGGANIRGAIDFGRRPLMTINHCSLIRRGIHSLSRSLFLYPTAANTSSALRQSLWGRGSGPTFVSLGLTVRGLANLVELASLNIASATSGLRPRDGIEAQTLSRSPKSMNSSLFVSIEWKAWRTRLFSTVGGLAFMKLFRPLYFEGEVTWLRDASSES